MIHIKENTVSRFGFSPEIIMGIFNLFSPREKKILFFISVLSIALGFLDLLGVALVGVVGSLAIVNFGGGVVGDRVSKLISLIRIEEWELSNQIALICIVTSLFLISKSLLSIFVSKKSLGFLARRSAALSSRLVSLFFTQPITGIKKNNTQETIYSLTAGVQILTVGVVGTALTLFADVWLLTILSIGLFVVSPMSAFISLFVLGTIAVILYRNSQIRVKHVAKSQAKWEVSSYQNIQNLISVYRELLVSNRRSTFINKIISLRFQIADGQARLQFFANLPKFTLEIALVVFCVLLGLQQFTINSPTRAIATVTIFMVAGFRMIPAIARLQHGLFSLKANYLKAGPTLDLIRALKQVEVDSETESQLGFQSGPFCASVLIKGLHFKYDEKKDVISGINLEIQPGEFVAIVGASGQGKSTLVDLALGILEPNAGSITISGLMPRKAFQTWPNAVAYVSQNAPLVDGSIRDNLTLGLLDEDFSEKDLWSALEKANLKSFVLRLPEKLSSSIGDQGSKLSGGQRQRLAIARALFANPKLLILDEALNALDSKNKLRIMQNLSKLRTPLTLLMVTHEKALVRDFESVYSLSRGKLTKVKHQKIQSNRVPYRGSL